MSRLYIIGNGFDLFHGYETSYSDFYQYLSDEACYGDMLSSLEQYWFNVEDKEFWSDFEENLGNLDDDSLMMYAREYSTNINDENPKYNGVEIEVDRIFEPIVGLRKVIIEFIRDATKNLPNAGIDIDINAKFINFNYSKTLEVIYKVNTDNIFYIHGNIDDEKVILGHREDNPFKSYYAIDEGSYDYSCEIGTGAAEYYFNEIFKNSEQIIQDNTGYFENLKETKEIVVLGHSLSNVDKAYFDKIHRCVDDCTWFISCHQDEDIPKKENFLLNIGVLRENIKFFPM
ncbi:unnamed protein product [uncultured Gammaproteobacteria bacterium]|jgi:hypothetical protein|nr:unnamed protein product [uncultured Gammaproteobacteria bacterium]VVH64734.1 unnamed protein product [uncultured Gammaproteobacteria bacterium]